MGKYPVRKTGFIAGILAMLLIGFMPTPAGLASMPKKLMVEMMEMATLGETVRLFERVRHEYPDLTVYLSVYEARIVSGEPKMLEHSDIKWILPREIDDYDFCPADEAILRKIKKEF